MKTPNNKHRNLSRTLGLLGIGIISAFAVPSISAATTLVPDEPAPIAATGDDSDCQPAAVALQVDITTGNVYIVNSTGGLTLTDNEINVYFGKLSSVLLDIEYSSGEFEVEISPSGGTTVVQNTRGGGLRYWISDTPTEYLISSTPLGVSTMMNMTPVVPDIIIKPKKDCPPPP